MIRLKSEPEIAEIARGGAIIGELLGVLEDVVRPGVTTAELDRLCEDFIRSHDGAIPAFKGLYGFPGAVCTSTNAEVVHGIPSPSRILADGDIVSLDVGVKLNGWCSDSASTFTVGEVDAGTRRLLEVTRQALDRAIAAAMPGNHVGDIGAAVEATVRGTGFAVVRDLVGHGVGREVHEAPQVPNFGRPGQGPRLLEGMVLAIEPMLSAGAASIRTLDDGWTVVTSDGSRSAHFEHTVAVTGRGARVLTAAPRPVPAST
ncbi:MAG: type I methionyl aminopeptidase [Gammaproteobacteria bacterium]|nr:type I methionyl aminopeptidase [Gammaproteobacteria bacterium]